MTESRQVRRAKERKAGKSGNAPATHEVYYIPLTRKSRAGVEYTYYKKVTDKIGLRKDESTSEDSVD